MSRVYSPTTSSTLGGLVALVVATSATQAGCPSRSTKPTNELGSAIAPSEVMLSALHAISERPLPAPPDRFEPTGRMLALEKAAGKAGAKDGSKAGAKDGSEAGAKDGSEAACSVWRIEDGSFIGDFPTSACAKWGKSIRQSTPSLRELRPKLREVPALLAATKETKVVSPDISREAIFVGATLRIVAQGGSQTVSRYAHPSCQNAEKSPTMALAAGSYPCSPIIAVAWSPDGQRLAIAHHGESRLLIVNAADGAVARQLALSGGDGVVPGLLVWGAAGISLVAGTVLSPQDEKEPLFGAEETQSSRRSGPPLRAYAFPDLQTGGTPLPVDDLVRGESGVLLDREGRYFFVYGTAEDGTLAIEGYELKLVPERVMYSSASKEHSAVTRRTDVVSKTWLPGRYPAWQTVEVETTTDPNADSEEARERQRYTIYRLYTAPRLDGPRLEQVPLSGPPPLVCESQAVLGDGRTVVPADPRERFDSCANSPFDPSGRLRGVSKNTLERVTDQVRIEVGPKGCLYSAGGLYSCLSGASERRYVIGIDPMRALFLTGDQLSPLLFAPNLLELFLEGKPLPAPARDVPLGLPPRLRVVSVKPQSGTLTGPVVTLEVASGGSGVGSLRLYRDDEPLGSLLPLKEGKQAIELMAVSSSCQSVRMYACNSLGFVCSTAVQLAPCRSLGGEEESE